MKFVTFEIGGITRQIKFTHNAIAEVEQLAKMGLSEMFNTGSSFMAARYLLWAGLRHKGALPAITLDQAGQMLDDVAEQHGNIDPLVGVLLEGLRKCGVLKAPPVADQEADGENPPKEATH